MARTDLGNGWWEFNNGDSAEIEEHCSLIAGAQQQASSGSWVELIRMTVDFAMAGRFVKQELAEFRLASFVGGAGVTWEVRLYNVTDGAQLALITVTATAVTSQVTNFSLPFVRKDISVEARQTVGGAQPLNIRNAMLCWSCVI